MIHSLKPKAHVIMQRHLPSKTPFSLYHTATVHEDRAALEVKCEKLRGIFPNHDFIVTKGS